jgi:mRNA-degrading endonuclease RelE of RelBE toxin-antitoxin system
MYRILVSRKVLRSIPKMPESIQVKLANLVEDLRDIWSNTNRVAKLQSYQEK